VGKRRGRTDFRVKNASKLASVLWVVIRAKRQVRSVTRRACRLEPGRETQYIALTMRVIQELTCCCTMSRNDSVFLIYSLDFPLDSALSYNTGTTEQSWMYACVFVHCWTHLLKTCLVLSLAVCMLTVSIHMQARSQTINTVCTAPYSVGAYTFFGYIYIDINNGTYTVSTCYS